MNSLVRKVMEVIIWIPVKVHERITHCLGEKKCFLLWTWYELSVVVCLLMWVSGVLLVFVAIPLYLFNVQ
jgi:hypothetical protein